MVCLRDSADEDQGIISEVFLWGPPAGGVGVHLRGRSSLLHALCGVSVVPLPTLLSIDDFQSNLNIEGGLGFKSEGWCHGSA